MAKRDILGCAQTGTGKTASFAIPIIQHLQANKETDKRQGIKALILTPTRELALQISECIDDYSKYTRVRHGVIFGGVNQRPQVDMLRKGIDILVATPGRLLDLINQGHIHLTNIEYFVLDEADRMLDMGFIHDIKRILPKLPKEKQTLFFSATMPDSIIALTKSLLKNPVKIYITPKSSTVDSIKQIIYFVEKKEKSQLLISILQKAEDQSVLIFSRTKHNADKIVRILGKAGIGSQAIHGNKSQAARQSALGNFKSGKTKVMVATDIASRGIDINELPLVINYDLPDVPETYVHRIGRTGRANREGKAYTIVVGKEERYLKEIERKTKSHIEKLEVPTLTQIHQHKVTELMYKLEDMILHGEHKPMKDLVNQIENHMLKDVTAALIELSLNQQIGFPYTKEKLESSSKRKKGASEGYTRLFLTVGSMDKAKKKDIIHFLVSKANIRESDIQGIDIKRKFTFVNINDKAVKKVMRHCQKEKLNGRKVEIEQANSR